jgi:ABC-type proline/glycine betaine transport system permease subunit
MQRYYFLFLLLGLSLLLFAAFVGTLGSPTAASGGLAGGLGIAGGLSLVAAALVIRRSQEDEATIRTLERRVFDLEAELEARAGERDDEP